MKAKKQRIVKTAANRDSAYRSLTKKLRMSKINSFNSMILYKKIVHGNCIKIFRQHPYKYAMVSKNKFILNIRSLADGLIAFFGLIIREVVIDDKLLL